MPHYDEKKAGVGMHLPHTDDDDDDDDDDGGGVWMIKVRLLVLCGPELSIASNEILK